MHGAPGLRDRADVRTSPVGRIEESALNVGVLIPAYNPPASASGFIRQLAASEVPAIIVVNDGSGKEYNPVFEEIARIEKVSVLDHAVNLGKGAALKTGLNYAYCRFENLAGVVSADADGQHLVSDILKVARALEVQPENLVMGVRNFDRNVPFRSKFGNRFTKHLVRLLVGMNLTDTQTGLRGIPRALIPGLLKIDSRGYEFELDMLFLCKLTHRPIVEQTIETVYLDGNKSSHFNPLTDSMKIYFILLRFTLTSLLTAGIDTIVFLTVYSFLRNILISQVSARSVALLFNYFTVKKVVFYSNQSHWQVFPKYIALVIASGLASYAMISLFTSTFSVDVVIAKMTAELIIYLANFSVQRDLIFKSETRATDWNSYYSKPYKTATYTRRIVGNILTRLIKRYGPGNASIRIAELGGANSCFYDTIREKVKPAAYHAIDNNEFGLLKLRDRIDPYDSVQLHKEDILNMQLDQKVDLVFSVGLIEHFSAEETAKAIEAHFALLDRGGVAILSFPTPTFLYIATRFLAQMGGLWIFHDERPLRENEVKKALAGLGTVLYSKIIWPIVLTQRIMVVRKD